MSAINYIVVPQQTGQVHFPARLQSHGTGLCGPAGAQTEIQRPGEVVSNASLASDDCGREVALASLRGLEILQVFLEEGGLKDEVRDSHHLGRAFQTDASTAHRSELARALKEQVLARG